MFEDVPLQVLLGRHGGDLPGLVHVELVVVQLTLFVLLQSFLGPPVTLLDLLLDLSERPGLPQFLFPLKMVCQFRSTCFHSTLLRVTWFTLFNL